VKRKPDLLIVLLALFGFGVIVTFLAPMSATYSVAEPISAQRAGMLTDTHIDNP
jgi:hypothetical protein